MTYELKSQSAFLFWSHFLVFGETGFNTFCFCIGSSLHLPVIDTCNHIAIAIAAPQFNVNVNLSCRNIWTFEHLCPYKGKGDRCMQVYLTSATAVLSSSHMSCPSSLLVFTKSWRLSCWRCLEKIFCSFDLDINFSPTSKLFQSLSLNNYTLSSMHDPLKSIDISLRQSYTGHVSAKGLNNSHCNVGLVHITYHEANFPRHNLLTPPTMSEMQLINILLKISDCRG